MKNRILPALAGALMVTVLAGPALAGAAGDRAVAHFKAIGDGRVEAIVGAYADKAVLHWVGGPLDGAYGNRAAIEAVWRKFTSAQGKLGVEVGDLREYANPKGVTVSANVRFVGKKAVPVRYVLTYRGDRLVNEIWQIDPRLEKY